MARNVEEKVVFGVGYNGDAGVPMVMIGVPNGAWEYMKDGKTHTFDLTKVGIPVQIIMYGAKDHAEAMKMIELPLAAAGVTYENRLNQDFSIEPEKP